jgi:zinc transport system substrate-binding protein
MTDNTHHTENKPPFFKRKKFVVSFIALLLGVLIIVFFPKTHQENAQTYEPLILVSVPPYKKIVNSLVGKKFRVESVVPNGFDPHLYDAKPNDMKKLKDAVIWFGIGEPFEQKLLTSMRDANVQVTYVNLIDEIERSKDKNLLITTQHHCEHDHHHGHGSCAHQTYDRHLWLSLNLDSVQASIIVSKLSDLYPHFKEVFEGYLEELIREHEVLANWIEANIKDARPITFLTPHPAFSYFAREFDITQVPIEVEGKEPNIQDLNQLLSQLKTQHIDCVIVQPQHPKKAAEYLAKDLDVPVYMIDPYNENYLDTCNRLGLSLAHKRKIGTYADH